MSRWLARAMSVPVVVALLGGCAGLTGSAKTAGPPTHAERQRAARDEAIDNARNKLARARSAGGEFAAPYHFYLAEEYFDLAVQEAREGDREAVIEFAERSAAYSGEAIGEAGRDKR